MPTGRNLFDYSREAAASLFSFRRRVILFDDLYIRAVRLKPHSDDVLGYTAAIPAIRNLKRLQLKSPVTFFVGENGSGKSTLLEAIAVAFGFNPEGGTQNFHFSTSETHSPLYRFLTLEKGIHRPKDGFFLRAESFYNVASEVDRLEEVDRGLLRSYGGKSLHGQSHGESFLSLALNRFGGKGLYLLDEPEAALSPQNQLTLLSRIHQLVQLNSQFIIATHSPILMACPEAEIYAISAEGAVSTEYEQTEHYQITKSFLENPKRMLRYLLNEDE